MMNIENIYDIGARKYFEQLYKQNDGEPTSGDYWRASGAGLCFRSRFWKRKGKKEAPLPPHKLGTFRIGHLVHEDIQNQWDKAGILVHKEKQVEGLGIRGHFDAIIRDGEKKILYEIKTVHPFMADKLKKEGVPEHNIQQARVYWLLINEYSDHGKIDAVRLFHIEKGSCLTFVHEYIFGEEDKNKVIKEFSELDTYWKNDVLPEAKPMNIKVVKNRETSWECQYCGYATECEGYLKYAKVR